MKQSVAMDPKAPKPSQSTPSTARAKRLLPLAFGLSLLVACHGRGGAHKAPISDGARAAKQEGTLQLLDLRKGMPEATAESLFAEPLPSATDVITRVREIARDPKSKGVMVRFGAKLGIASGLELASELAAIRALGKPVYCHADGYNNVTYAIAARGCDRIALSPAGELELVGVGTEIIYFRRFLADELKVSIDILQVGKFKGAEEPMTRDGPSPEARASLEKVLADLRNSWRGVIDSGRKKNGVDLASAELGPYMAEEGKRLGFVDEVAYLDQERSELAARTQAKDWSPALGKDSRANRTLRKFAGASVRGPLALVVMEGSIGMGGSESRSSLSQAGVGLLGGSNGITDAAFSPLLDKLASDDEVKAVVLRIDSPGGSALASDLLWHKLMNIRAKKPLVVSIGDMAASGGYYLASAGTRIFASETSIVGSIGVVGGKVSFGSALERFGVHSEAFSGAGTKAAAERATYASGLRAWDPETRKRVLVTMEQVYDLFLRRLTEGRKIDRKILEASAEGRIFSGKEGKERQLVDELGSMQDALNLARTLAHLPENTEANLASPKAGLPFGGDDDSDDEASANRLRLPDVRLQPTHAELAPASAWMRAYLPLLQNERVLTASPYGFVIQ
jgi:protease IV